MEASREDVIYTMALAKMGAYHLVETLLLYKECEDIKELFFNSDKLKHKFSTLPTWLLRALSTKDEYIKQAEKEYDWNVSNGIQMLCYGNNDYPFRLNDCKDAPLVLFYKGTESLNTKRIVCIVGTRHCTMYGKDLIKRFITELKQYCPKALIVSGLAYGVDINAHRLSLDNGFPSVGVLAHGLDTLYPSSHKETALKMLQHGGLLTEYTTQTKTDKLNFVRRNRIVAGISDACVLIESAEKGGGLITAGISQDYNRDVFAFPGAIGAPFSVGCNELIAKNGAMLLTSAKHFVQEMGWIDDVLLNSKKEKGIERSLFPELSPQEMLVIKALQKHNNLQINTLVVQTNLPIATLTSILFELEMKGLIQSMAGGSYHLFT